MKFFVFNNEAAFLVSLCFDCVLWQ